MNSASSVISASDHTPAPLKNATSSSSEPIAAAAFR